MMKEYVSKFLKEEFNEIKETVKEAKKKLNEYLFRYQYNVIHVSPNVMGRYHGYGVLGFTDGKRIELLPDEILGYLKAHVLCHELAHIKFLKENPESVRNEEKVDYKAKEMLLNYK